MSQLRIALVQMDIVDGDPARNLARAGQLIDTHAGAALYLLPELWTSGYVHQQWPAIAREDTPRTLEALQRLAARHQAVIGGTLLSLNDDHKLVNRFWMVDRGGVVGCYDKAHLFPPMDEPAHLTPGPSRRRVRLGAWTAAQSICYDLRFPEMYLHDALDGADVFLVPSEWPAERAETLRALAVARAIETQSYVAVTNRVGTAADGTRFDGGSVIVGPGGEIVASAGETPEVVTADLDQDRVARVRGPRPHFAGRRAGVDW